MKKWSFAKLCKELAFAEACKNDSPASMTWYEKVLAEFNRRAG